MPNLRRKILKEVFEKGVGALKKEELEKLFKGAKGKLYRYDTKPEELLRRGFDLRRTGNYADFAGYDIPGLYWGPSKKEVTKSIGELPASEVNVEGLARPGAKVQVMEYPWERSFKTWKAPSVKPDADLISRVIRDPKGRFGSEEVIQLKPGNVLAKMKIGSKEFYRILGILGALEASGRLEKVLENAE